MQKIRADEGEWDPVRVSQLFDTDVQGKSQGWCP